MDDLVKAAVKAAEFIGSVFTSLRIVICGARVPPDKMPLADEQMTINYKAIGASIILLFLARALEGIHVNEVWGSVFVVAIFVAVVVFLRLASDGVAALSNRLMGVQTPEQSGEISKRWFSLLIAIWTLALVFVVVHGLAHNFLRMRHWNLFLETSLAVPLLSSSLALLVVVLKTKLLDRQQLGSPKAMALYSAAGIVLISAALWVGVFWRWA